MPYAGPMPDAPVKRIQTITVSDGTTYDPPITLLRVATAGNVAIVGVMPGDTAQTILSVNPGEVLMGPFSKVMLTNTTATGFTAWFNE